MSEIRVNNIVAANGSSAPQFPAGFSLATGMGITNSPNLTGSAVTFSGLSQITNSTDSTSSTTGSLVVTGGVGIAKNVYIGAGLSVAGTLTYEDVTNVDSVGVITAKSGVNISGGELLVGSNIKGGTAGVLTATTFVGNVTGNVTGDLTGTADLATSVTVTANNSTNETVYPIFVDGATGTQGAESDTGLTYNPSSGNLGIGGQLAAASLDISGNADIDGTMEADAYTVNGTALNSYIAGITVTNATNAAHVYITDNESTNENNNILFIENAGTSSGNAGVEMDGNFFYNPSTGRLTATQLSGTLQTAAQTNITSLGTLTSLTISGDLTLDNGEDANKDITWDVSADSLIFKDSVYAKFGTDSDAYLLHDGNHFYIENGTGEIRIRPKSSENAIVCVADGATTLYHDNSAKIATTNDGVSITGMTTTSAGMTFNGMLKEEVNITAGKLSDNTNIDVADGMIHYFTTQESTTCTPNIRFNSSYSLLNKMSVGQSITVTVITTADASGYSANWTIDGNSITEQWNGGSAPSEGGSDGYDVYTITIVHYADANGDSGYKMFANLSNFT